MTPVHTPRRTLRILACQNSYKPEEVGIGYYSAACCEWLAERGHAVRAICPPPYYPYWRVFDGYRAWRYECERIAGVETYRCPAWVPSRLNSRNRLLHNLSFAASALPALMRQAAWRPDVVVVTVPSILSAPAAWALARACGAVAWLHVQDLELDLAAQLQQVRRGPAVRLAFRLESALLRRFDVVSSISEPMLQRLAQKGVPPGRLNLLPNWVDPVECMPDPQAAGAYRSQLGCSNGEVLCLFSGSLGAKQGVSLILDAARRLSQRPDLRFAICGDGPGRESLEREARGLANVRLIPLQPRHRLQDLLAAADIHLLTQRAEAADLVLPSKLLGIMASGRPVIATAQSGTALHEMASRCGMCVPPGNSGALAEAIMDLAPQPAFRAALGSSGRDYVMAHFHRDLVLARLEGEMFGRTGVARYRQTAAEPRFATKADG